MMPGKLQAERSTSRCDDVQKLLSDACDQSPTNETVGAPTIRSACEAQGVGESKGHRTVASVAAAPYARVATQVELSS
jgi:hypothetical protein